MTRPGIFVITGLSGAGKSTIINHIKENFDLAFAVSHTTRKPRKNEVNGVDYYFVDENTFKKMVNNDDFIEWKNVYGHLYGTSKKEIKKIQQKDRDIILDLDIQGAHSIRELYPESIIIFITTKTISELKKRLKKRGEKALEKRLKPAYNIVNEIDNFDYIIINENLENTIKKVEKIIKTESSNENSTKNRMDKFDKNQFLNNFFEK